MRTRTSIAVALLAFLVQPLTASALPKPLSADQLAAAWKSLGNSDDEGAKQARNEMSALVERPEQAVTFLKSKIRPVPPGDRAALQKCIDDLECQAFKEREAATRKLEELGILAAPAIARALREEQPNFEKRCRLEKLQQKLDRIYFSAD